MVRKLHENNGLIDIRFHGRGGQGVVTASRLVGEAAILEGYYVHAFPTFGPERSGAPVAAFTRISPKKFTIKTEVYEPDIVVIIDPTLIGKPFLLEGLKKNGKVIVNTPETDGKKIIEALGLQRDDIKVAYLDATKIAVDIIGKPFANTVVLGALSSYTGVVKLESLKEVIRERFKDEEIASKNIAALEQAAKEVKEV